MAFGGGGNGLASLMPSLDEIPDEFKRGKTKWNQVFNTWFFKGLDGKTDFKEYPGVDGRTALRPRS